MRVPPPRVVVWRVFAEQLLHHKRFPQIAFPRSTNTNILFTDQNSLVESGRYHSTLESFSISTRSNDVEKSLLFSPTPVLHLLPSEKTDGIRQTQSRVSRGRRQKYRAGTTTPSICSSIRNFPRSQTFGIPCDQAIFLRRSSPMFSTPVDLCYTVTTNYTRHPSQNQFPPFKHTPSIAGTLSSIHTVARRTTLSVPPDSNNCVPPAAVLSKSRSLRHDTLKNVLLRNVADAPAFRLRGGGIHVSKAQKKKYAEAATASTRSGKFLYVGVLGIFVFTLLGTPLWFAFFYEAQKAKYEELSRIETYGDEDA